jgi:hypothetical protein
MLGVQCLGVAISTASSNSPPAMKAFSYPDTSQCMGISLP